jgi:type III pantothenate kinase
MLIAIDIGNSSINIGLFSSARRVVRRIETYPLRSCEEYCSLLSGWMDKSGLEKSPLGGIISSVVGDRAVTLRQALVRIADQGDIDIVNVSHLLDSGLKYTIDRPDEIGPDRIAAAVGASSLYGVPVAAVDLGTATTITVVDKDFQLVGGAIMPGMGLMGEMLEKGTSRLKGIKISEPQTALGKDTNGCIQSGVYYGTAGGVDRILAEIEEEMGCSLHVVVTGGYGHSADRFLRKSHVFSPELVLEGLKLLYEKNRRL